MARSIRSFHERQVIPLAQILCSTGALIGMPNGRNYRLLETFAPQLDCDGFEFMMYETWYDQVPALLSYLTGLRLPFPVMHADKGIGELISLGEPEAFRRFELNCDIARHIGANKVVLHLWNGLTSDSRIDENLAAYGRLRAIAADRDLDLLVENVLCSHQDPLTHWQSLRERYPNVHFIFDTKMAHFHRQLDQFYASDFDVRHYHVNDHAGALMDWKSLRTLPLGAGEIDFDAFFAHIRRTGYSGTFTVEATAFDRSGNVDLDMLNRCFSRIRASLS